MTSAHELHLWIVTEELKRRMSEGSRRCKREVSEDDHRVCVASVQALPNLSGRARGTVDWIPAR